MSMYNNSEYLENNPTWGIEDSPYKVSHILDLLKSNNITPSTIADIGCGAGEILSLVDKGLKSPSQCTGFDISSHLEPMWQKRRSKSVNFSSSNFLETNSSYDLLLLIDIVEHIDDYIGFLKEVKDKGTYKLFNFPLEIFALKAVLTHKFTETRKKYGHIHYFNREICLEALKAAGYEIIEDRYAAGAIDLASTTTSISPQSKLLKIPRLILSKFSEDLTAKTLGGYSLYVLAK